MTPRLGSGPAAAGGWEKENVDFDLLRRAIDLPALIGRDTVLKHNGREWRGKCPIHGGRNPNFRVWETKSGWAWCCYSKCGRTGGDAVRYLVMKDGLTPTEAIAELYRMLRGGAVRRTRTLERPAPRMPQPLCAAAVQPFVNLLDLPIDPRGIDRTTPRDLWHTHGLSDPALDRFQLGYCPSCPTAYDPDRPDAQHPSLTIPVYDEHGVLLNIRHRLLRPLGGGGDKYRPHAAGLGAHLFNVASLFFYPDGTPRHETRLVLDLEGEKKVAVGFSLDDWLLGYLYPVISADAGAHAWLSGYGDAWEPLLWPFERVVVVRDPGMRHIAEQVARRFGRAGCVLELPGKIDDWLLEDPVARLPALIAKIEDCRPLLAPRMYPGLP